MLTDRDLARPESLCVDVKSTGEEARLGLTRLATSQVGSSEGLLGVGVT